MQKYIRQLNKITWFWQCRYKYYLHMFLGCCKITMSPVRLLKCMTKEGILFRELLKTYILITKINWRGLKSAAKLRSGTI